MPEWESRSTLVIDNGSCQVKAGFAGDDSPKVCFSNVVGRPRIKPTLKASDYRDLYVGDEAQSKRGILRLQCPIENGKIHDWDLMEKIWYHTFMNELKENPEGRSVLLSEPPLARDSDREKTLEVMFESMKVPALFLEQQGVLALQGAGRQTGTIFDSGESVTHTIPIFEGYCVPRAIRRINFAGRSLTEWMMKCLNKKSCYEFTTTAEREVVREIKEKCAYVAGNYAEEMKTINTRERKILHGEDGGGAAKEKEGGDDSEKPRMYTLPDCTKINVSYASFMCPEPLFNPMLMGREFPGAPAMIHKTIMDCDLDIRKELYNGIILVGGTTMCTGFHERLEAELVNNLAPKDIGVKVIAKNERKYLTWMGGSILAGLGGFPALLMTKAEYEEVGPDLVHKKCPM